MQILGRTWDIKSFSSLFLALVVMVPGTMCLGPHALAQQSKKLQIRVLEGSNRIVKKDESLEIVVEVRDGTSEFPAPLPLLP